MDGLSAAAIAAVETRLTEAVRAEPEAFVPGLEVWRRRGGTLTTEESARLRAALWRLLPEGPELPVRRTEAAAELGGRFREALAQESGVAR
jgi:hypothetical protein